MEIRLPVPILNEIVGHMLGHEDMAGIATIEDALRDVDSRARDVDTIVHIRDLIDRAAVNAHSDLKCRRITQLFCNLQGTANRLLQALEIKKRHAVASGQTNQLVFRFRSPKTIRAPNDAV